MRQHEKTFAGVISQARQFSAEFIAKHFNRIIVDLYYASATLPY